MSHETAKITSLSERSIAAAVMDSIRGLARADPEGRTIIIKNLNITVNYAQGGGAMVVTGGEVSTK